MKLRWTLGAIALLIPILGLGVTRLFSQTPTPAPLAQQQVIIPEAILPCLPKSSQRELKAALRSGATTYYAIGSYRHQEYRQLLIALDRQNRCQNLIPENAPTPDNFLSAYVSWELAQQIALQIYSQTIQQQGGTEQFQQRFQAVASQMTRNPGYLSPEQGWALQQLGIEIPDQIRIVTAEQYRQLLAQRMLTHSPKLPSLQ